MHQIAEWLEKLGMSEYAQSFAANGINVAALPHLTDQDLKDIGVLLGHRRIMLAAISKLAGAAAATPEPTARAEPKAQDTAERRQVTVMFADLVGSTALSARMDPEDLREVISAYQKCVAETVQRFDGFVAKYMGDGVLVYFGYPQAHEDNTERAVRAGLELVTAVGSLKTHATLQTRVGVATGLVVVGDLIGSGASQEQTIVGETPNLAARLQGIAEPNSVVIAESTRKLLGNLFELEDLGAQNLRGIAGPVRAWAALRPSAVESRFEALHGGGLTELVGREEELDLLLRRWSKAKSSEGHHLFRGEPRDAMPILDRAVRVATEAGIPRGMWANFLNGWALAVDGGAEAGVSRALLDFDAPGAAGQELLRPFYTGVLADMCRAAGRLDDGLRLVNKALELATTLDSHWGLAEAHRIKGELLLARGEAEAAVEPCFETAIGIARRQGARSWELRAAISFARFRQSQGRAADAKEQLAPVYGWFTEGFDTLDLKEAKALLDELSS